MRIGSSKAIVMNAHKKLIFEAPARVALSLTSGKILAFGDAAVDLASLGAPDIKVVSLFSHGIPTDIELCREYLLWMRDSFTTTWLRRVVPYPVVMAYPVHFAKPYRVAFEDVLRSAHFFPIASHAAVVGDAWMEMGNQAEKEDSIIIRMGATQTQLALMNQGIIVNAVTIDSGGDDLDRAFVRYVRKTYQVSLPYSSAGPIKESFTKAQFAKNPFSVVVRGKSVESSDVRSVTLGESDLSPLYAHFFDSLSISIFEKLMLTFHFLEGSESRKIYLSGGLSMFAQAKYSLENIVGSEVTVVSRPTVASVLGIVSKIS